MCSSDLSDWAAATGADTVVLYMASRDAPTIAASLIAGGKSPELPVVLVENASLPASRRHATTLRRLAVGDVPELAGPALLCVGEVYRGQLAAGGEADGRSTPAIRVAAGSC